MKGIARILFFGILALAIAMPAIASGSQEEGLTEEEAQAVAEAAAELEEEGYSRSEVAEATLDAVAELHEQIQSWQNGELDAENLGTVVKDTVRDTATAAAAERSGSEQDSAGRH